MKLDDLSPDLQEKFEMCESAEELEKLAQAEGVELSEEDLDGIAGGLVRNWRIRTHQPSVLKKTKPQPAPQPNPDPAPPAEGTLSGTEGAE